MLVCPVVGYTWIIHAHKQLMNYGELEDFYLVSCGRLYDRRYWITSEPEDLFVQPD